MASIKTKFTVGVFVIIGFSIAAFSVIWLGMSNYFEGGKFYSSYFNESIQGLSKDSSVKYRGVSIGRVERVGVAPDGTLIEVILKIESGLRPDEDLVAQIKSIGITGIMFVELDQILELERDESPKIKFKSKYPIVPTKPSEINEIIDTVYDVLHHAQKLDLEGISNRVKDTLDRIDEGIEDAQIKTLSKKTGAAFDRLNKVVEDAQISKISADIRNSISRLDKILDTDKWKIIFNSINEASSSFNTLTENTNNTVSKVKRVINENQDRISQTLSNINRAVDNANSFLENGADLISKEETRLADLQSHLILILQNIESASRNLDALIRNFGDNPSQMIFGEPPPERKIER